MPALQSRQVEVVRSAPGPVMCCLDYLLRYSDALPIAVVEAKAEGEIAEADLEQAKAYAREIGVAFPYATNGERDSSTTSSPTRTAPKTPFHAGPCCRRSGSIPTNCGLSLRHSGLHPLRPSSAHLQPAGNCLRQSRWALHQASQLQRPRGDPDPAEQVPGGRRGGDERPARLPPLPLPRDG